MYTMNSDVIRILEPYCLLQIYQNAVSHPKTHHYYVAGSVDINVLNVC